MQSKTVVNSSFVNLVCALCIFGGWTTLPTLAQPVGPEVKQLIVGLAPGWNSMNGHAQLFDRTSDGWKAHGPAFAVLFGKHGLAWGRGLMPGDSNGPTKVEHDNRAPAGLFRIGLIYTYDASLPAGANYPFHQVAAGDAWVDDVKNPYYNQFVHVDKDNPPGWFDKQKMRHGDFAYRWLVEVRHNSDPPVPGFGSAIFFHIRRGAQRPSAGCTTMSRTDLINLIRWLRAEDRPEYVCLPVAEYIARWKNWGLPDPKDTILSHRPKLLHKRIIE